MAKTLQQPRIRSVQNYFILQAVIVVFSFAIAFIGGQFIYVNLPWFPILIGQAFGSLYAPLNDAFWVSTIIVYALIQMVIIFIRAKTGSKI